MNKIFFSVIIPTYNRLKKLKLAVNSVLLQNVSNYEKLKFEEKIIFKELIFAYERSGSNILSNIKLEIKKGDNIVIVGRSGSGKSTLIDIVLGLLQPSYGNLSIDDKILNNEN